MTGGDDGAFGGGEDELLIVTEQNALALSLVLIVKYPVPFRHGAYGADAKWDILALPAIPSNRRSRRRCYRHARSPVG